MVNPIAAVSSLKLWLSQPKRLLQLRLIVLLGIGWWLMAPLSALLARGLSSQLRPADAVLMASFLGPMLSIGVIVVGLWPKRLWSVMLVLVLLIGSIQIAAGVSM